MFSNLYKNQIVNIIFFLFPFSFFRYSLSGINDEYLVTLLKIIGSYCFYLIIFFLLVLGLLDSKKFIKRYLFYLTFIFSFLLFFYDIHNIYLIKNFILINFILFVFLIFFYNQYKINVNYFLFSVSLFIVILILLLLKSETFLSFNLENIIRSNPVSYFIFFVYAFLFFINKIGNKSLLFFCIFLLLFSSFYIKIATIILTISFFINKKKFKLLILSILLLLIFLNIISFLLIYYDLQIFINFFNFFFKFFLNTENNSLAFISDQYSSFYYQINPPRDITQINLNFYERYVGMISRLLIFKIHLNNLFNNNLHSADYINHFYLHSVITTKEVNYILNSLNIDHFSLLKECHLNDIEIDKCFYSNTKFFLDDLFLYSLKINQSFNNSHNSFITLFNLYGVLGFFYLTLFIYLFLSLLLSKKILTNQIFFIICFLIIINFEDYLFGNFFNLSIFIWIFFGNFARKILS
jgi:hypothetical protein